MVDNKWLSTAEGLLFISGPSNYSKWRNPSRHTLGESASHCSMLTAHFWLIFESNLIESISGIAGCRVLVYVGTPYPVLQVFLTPEAVSHCPCLPEGNPVFMGLPFKTTGSSLSSKAARLVATTAGPGELRVVVNSPASTCHPQNQLIPLALLWIS